MMSKFDSCLTEKWDSILRVFCPLGQERNRSYIKHFLSMNSTVYILLPTPRFNVANMAENSTAFLYLDLPRDQLQTSGYHDVTTLQHRASRPRLFVSDSSVLFNILSYPTYHICHIVKSPPRNPINERGACDEAYTIFQHSSNPLLPLPSQPLILAENQKWTPSINSSNQKPVSRSPQIFSPSVRRRSIWGVTLCSIMKRLKRGWMKLVRSRFLVVRDDIWGGRGVTEIVGLDETFKGTSRIVLFRPPNFLKERRQKLRKVNCFVCYEIGRVISLYFWNRNVLVAIYEWILISHTEGTLRGHIGLIENSLELLELETGSKKQDAKGGLKSWNRSNGAHVWKESRIHIWKYNPSIQHRHR